MITMHCTMEEIGGSSDICHLTPPSHTKPYQTIPKVQGSQGSMVQGSKVARYLKVIFKYELDSKEGPSCLILFLHILFSLNTFALPKSLYFPKLITYKMKIVSFLFLWNLIKVSF